MNEVLDRIELPREVTDKFATSTWLGSALIVSDEAPYKKQPRAQTSS